MLCESGFLYTVTNFRAHQGRTPAQQRKLPTAQQFLALTVTDPAGCSLTRDSLNRCSLR